LLRQEHQIGPYDVLIAGQAKARDLVLITRDVREFARVPEVQIENLGEGRAVSNQRALDAYDARSGATSEFVACRLCCVIF
jgi:hypothetical protein